MGSTKVFSGLFIKRNTRTKNRTHSLAYFILAIIAAVFVGRLAGSHLSDLMNEGFKGIDPGYFKQILEYRIPIIHTTYNSGSTKLSWNYELNGIFKFLFNFEPMNPLSIINTSNPEIERYYIARFLTDDDGQAVKDGKDSNGGKDGKDGNENAGNVADNIGNKNKPSGEGSDSGRGDTGRGGMDQKDTGGKNTGGTGTGTGTGDGSGTGTGMDQNSYIVDASSITYEDDEKKEYTNKKIVASGRVAIQNESKLKLTPYDIDMLLSEDLALNLNRKGPKVLVYHTHTTEGYLRSVGQLTKSGVSSWTNDARYSVVRVGDELTKLLKDKYRIEILHNGTVHDSPEYKLSYKNSLATIIKYQKSYPSLGVLLDVHRDALGSTQKLRRITTIDGKQVAQIMFVIGTNGSGLDHPYWEHNLKLAIKIQDKLVSKYPDLVVPIYMSNNRYNQHLSVGSLIIEAGGDGNTISECVESMKYLAWAINEVIFK